MATLHKEDGIVYQAGFGNEFESEAVPGALPQGRNNPRNVPLGLYAEQLSGTAFTSPRHLNRRTWMYRIQPSVLDGKQNGEYMRCGEFGVMTTNNDGESGDHDDTNDFVDPNPLRWFPRPMSDIEKTNSFVEGLERMAHSGSPELKDGLSIYMYYFGRDMIDEHFSNADGDLLIVPQNAALAITTELGRMVVHPKEFCVIPRGIIFSVQAFQKSDDEVHDSDPNAAGVCRGYVLEVYKGHFALPELGPIGSNGLANARDFLHPTAWFVSNKEEYREKSVIFTKVGGVLFERTQSHSPYNVVAWHGNYVPFKYNLERFCAVNSVTYDHMDPSIYTVLTCCGTGREEALADFVVFPPRVLATDNNTLRPPWFHRNTMTEFMGLICGQYDAKDKGGFQPGGASLHPCMTPHGPDVPSYAKAVNDPCETPIKMTGGMAFMFETTLQLRVDYTARSCSQRDSRYTDCWSGFQEGSGNSPDQFWELLAQSVQE